MYSVFYLLLLILVFTLVLLFRKNKSVDKKSNILIVTRENRDLPFIDFHDSNIKQYCSKHGYKYKRFKSNCDLPIYWCKISDLLANINNYDYVMWMDSDTHINDFNRRIEMMLKRDITIGHDDGQKIYNAGVFIVKNSTIGRNFLNDCMKYFKEHKESCVGSNGELKGSWSGMCYEQGVMNMFLKDKYKDYVHVTEEVSNSLSCKNNYFITHLYQTSPEDRLKCMRSTKNYSQG